MLKTDQAGKSNADKPETLPTKGTSASSDVEITIIKGSITVRPAEFASRSSCV